MQEGLREPEDRREWLRPLGLVLLSALAVRVYLVVNTPVITKDGVYNIRQAELMLRGDWFEKQVAAGEFEPIFPLAFLSFNSLVGDQELAVKIASATFGVLTAIPFFLVCRNVLNARIAFTASILYGLHPYLARNSAEGLTESTFLFFLFMALLLLMRGMHEPSMRWYLACAVMIIVARLARTEGIWLFPAVFVFLLWRFLAVLHRREWSASGPLIRFSLAFILLTIPVLILGKEVIGVSEFSSFKNFGGLTKVVEAIPSIVQDGVVRHGGFGLLSNALGKLWQEFIYKLAQAFHPVLFLLAAIPMLRQWHNRQFQDYWRLTLSVGLIYIGGVFLVWVAGIAPADRRYFIPGVAVGLPWAAVSIEMMATKMTNFFGTERNIPQVGEYRFVGQLPLIRGNSWSTMILISIILILGVKTIRPQRLDKVPIKEAGAWIVAQEVKHPVIVTHDIRIAFYARGEMLRVNHTLENKSGEEQKQFLREIFQNGTSTRGADFIFLKGPLYPEAEVAIRTSGHVEEITEWRSIYGDTYTLIQLKEGRE